MPFCDKNFEANYWMLFVGDVNSWAQTRMVGGGGKNCMWFMSLLMKHLLCILFTSDCIEMVLSKADKNTWNAFGSVLTLPKTSLSKVVVLWSVVKPCVVICCNSGKSMILLENNSFAKGRGYEMEDTSLLKYFLKIRHSGVSWGCVFVAMIHN